MNINALREWAKDVRLHGHQLPQTKQGIFDAVLGELVFLDDYEWGPLTQVQADKYWQIRKQFMEATSEGGQDVPR